MSAVRRWFSFAAPRFPLYPLSSSSRRLRFAQIEFFHHGLADQEFLNLARHCRRKSLHEPDIARYLVVGDLTAAKAGDFLGGGRLALAQPDPGAQLFAEFRVGHAHHLNILDLGKAKQKFFDFPRINVLTAANDQVLQPADYVAVSRFIDDREVAAVHPAAAVDGFGGSFSFAPITQHDRVAARAEFSAFTARHDVAGFVDNLHFKMRKHLSYGGDAP